MMNRRQLLAAAAASIFVPRFGRFFREGSGRLFVPSTGTFAVTGAGFQPSKVIFWKGPTRFYGKGKTYEDCLLDVVSFDQDGFTVEVRQKPLRVSQVVYATLPFNA